MKQKTNLQCDFALSFGLSNATLSFSSHSLNFIIKIFPLPFIFCDQLIQFNIKSPA